MRKTTTNKQAHYIYSTHDILHPLCSNSERSVSSDQLGVAGSPDSFRPVRLRSIRSGVAVNRKPYKSQTPMPYMAGGLRFPRKSHIPCSAMTHVRSIQQYGYHDQVSFKLFPLIIHNKMLFLA